MTKKLLLAASAVAAMAFAANANAGQITQATIKGAPAAPGITAGVDVTLVATPGVTAVRPYIVASERNVDAAANLLKGDIDLHTSFTGPITTNDPQALVPTAILGNTVNATGYSVVYTIAGGQFTTTNPEVRLVYATAATAAALASAASVDTAASAGGTLADAATGFNVTSALQADGSVRVTITKVAGTLGAADLIALRGVKLVTGLQVAAQNTISVAQRTVVGANTAANPFDSISATPVVSFSRLLRDAVSQPAEHTAALPDYTSFLVAGVATTPPTYTAAMATGVVLRSNSAALLPGTSFFRDLGGRAVSAADIVNSASLAVTGVGSPLDRLTPRITGVTSGTSNASSATATAARFNNINFADLSNAGYTFTLNNITAASRVTLDESNYSGAVELVYNTNYSGPASFNLTNINVAAPGNSYTSLGQIALEGTHFTAPWFSLNSTTNEASLRIANHGSAATGLVYVSLRAQNSGAAGVAQRARVEISNGQGIPAGGVLQVTGPQLATLLGTTAQNGDLRVTVQAQAVNLTGKVRVRNFLNQSTFEQSLHRLGGQ